MRALVLEAGDQPGGQLLRNPTPLLDCPGFELPTGETLARALTGHLTRLGGEVRTGLRALALDAARGEVTVPGATLRASFLLLATGGRRRTLGVPGEAPTLGRGIWPAARRHGEEFRGRPVLVVGGGDVALEEAALLAPITGRVILAHRGAEFRGRPDFQAAVRADPRIEILLGTQLLSIDGYPAVAGARLSGPGGERRVAVAGVLICAGNAPNDELVRGQAEADEQGFLRTDVRQRTSAPRLYAAGDLCSLSAWSAAAAIGQGAIAIKDIERRLSTGEVPAREDQETRP
jgi:thioredoxin reductase (NADPH)